MTTTTTTTAPASSTNPADEAVLADIARGLAAGEDVFGDEEELVREGAGGTPEGSTDQTPPNGTDTTGEDLDDLDVPGTTGDQPGAGEGGATEPGTTGAADDLDPDALADLADPLGLNTEPVRFHAEVPSDIKEQRTALRAEKAAAFQKLMDGEIDAAAYAAEEDRISESLDALSRQQSRAEVLQEVNRQNDETSNTKVINNLIRTAKAEVDYAADPKAIKQFDQALAMIGNDPDNAGLSFKEQTDKAHDMVKALRGVTSKTPTPTPTAENTNTGRKPGEAPDRRPKVNAPVTLRDMPNAAQAQTGGGVIEQMASLTGQAYEEAFAKLTPAQRASMLDGD